MNQSTLVLGASTNPSRYANMALHRLVDRGIPAQALGLKAGEVAGVIIETDPNRISKPDTITLYVGPKNQSHYTDLLLNLAPRRVIFNPGTENSALEKALEEEGIEVLRACTLVLLATNQY